MSRFAENTNVSPDRTEAEIRSVLRRYGATQYVSGWDLSAAMIGFTKGNRTVRFVLDMPSKNDKSFTRTPTGRIRRNPNSVDEVYEQALRQRWRALLLVIKAKLEAVEAGIATFDEEFSSYIVLPGGQTVGEWLLPQLDACFQNRSMPALLPFKKTGTEK